MKKGKTDKRKRILDKRTKKNKRIDLLKPVCWVIIPVTVIALLVLDALGIYTFNNERLIVLGICLLVVLLPFFSEITVKDLSVKRGKLKSQDDR